MYYIMPCNQLEPCQSGNRFDQKWLSQTKPFPVMNNFRPHPYLTSFNFINLNSSHKFLTFFFVFCYCSSGMLLRPPTCDITCDVFCYYSWSVSSSKWSTTTCLWCFLIFQLESIARQAMIYDHLIVMSSVMYTPNCDDLRYKMVVQVPTSTNVSSLVVTVTSCSSF